MRITQSLDERRHQAFGPGTIEDLVMSEDVMHPAGTHLFPTMDRVIFGKEAAATLAAEVDRLGKRRVFLMVSRTLNTTPAKSRNCAPRWANGSPDPMIRSLS